MRKTYEQRTRMVTKGAAQLARAFTQEIEWVADAAGNELRVWRPEELQTFKTADIAQALKGRRAHEYHELLAEIPPSAIKYAMTKGWLVWASELYFVTDKAAAEFKLPRKTPMGMPIKFSKAA